MKTTEDVPTTDAAGGPVPVPEWLDRERAQWQGIINDWADAYCEQGRELDELKRIIPRLKAFSIDCVRNGDMAPQARRMMYRIMAEY